MAAVISTAAGAQVVLKASHQFPGGRGDARDEMIQIIARDVKAANVGLEIQVHPGATLFKPNDQWTAMVDGRLDISSFPLDYASGKVPVFGATLMPGPVLMANKRSDGPNRAQQEAFGGAGRKSEAFFNPASKGLDDEMVNVFMKSNVEIIPLTAAEFDAWIKVAQQSSYKEFADEVPEGRQLIEQALAVK